MDTFDRIDFSLLKKDLKVFFIGIGGAGMSALAAYLLDEGFFVGGSDRALNNNCDRLLLKGATIFSCHDKNNLIGYDVVIVNSAISDDNEELVYAKENKIPILLRAQLLMLISEKFPTKIGVSGTHGKTTVTSLIANILDRANMKFTAFIGGDDKTLGNYHNSGNSILLSEICEFKRNIDYFSPSIGVTLNIDNDHLDSYDGFNDLKNTFYSFLDRSVCPIVNADDKNLLNYSSDAVTYGLYHKADYTAVDIKYGKTTDFTVLKNGKRFFRAKSKLWGEHNVLGVLAATAVADTLCIGADVIRCAVNDFVGVSRRNDLIGTLNGAKCYGDYAHHPREIDALLKAVLKHVKGKLIFVFQPHTYSRTRILFNEFTGVLSQIKHLYLYKTYSAREAPVAEYSAKSLASSIKNAEYFDDFDKLFDKLKTVVTKKDVIYFVGAGDIFSLASERLNV